MAGGQQITSGQGTVTAAKSEAVSGAEATTAAGTHGNERQHRLHSRKVGGGSATHQISGQLMTSAFGLFTPVPQLAPTGQVATLLGGSLGRERTVPMVGAGTTVAGGSLTASGGSGGSQTLESDWTARSTASGVFFAERFNDASRLVLAQAAGGSDPNGYIWTFPANVSHETTIKRSGGGSAKITILASAGADAGSLRLPIGQLRGNGTTTYYQYSIYTPEAFLRYKPTYSSGQGGWKSAIVSHTLSSNQNNEVVVQDTNRRGFPHLYWQDGAVTAVTADAPFGGSNFKFTPAVDRLAPASPVNGRENERRYGPIYDAPHLTDGSTPLPGTDVFARGYPSAEAKQAVKTWKPDGWYTILVKVTIGTLGTNSSSIDVWGCQTGQTYQHLVSATNVKLGPANSGHNAIWLLPYETARNPNTVPQSTFVCYAEVIASTQSIAEPMLTPMAQLAASMSSGSWAGLTVNGLTASLITRGDSDSIMSYARTCHWNPHERRIYFYGSTHGTQRLKRMIRYVESTNTWETDQDGAPETDGADSHGYHHFAMRPADGQQFIRHYGASTVSQRAPGGPWSTIANLPDSVFVGWNVNQALCWHPGLNSGSGGLVFAGDTKVYGTNAALSAWSTLHSSATLNGASNAIAYNQNDGCVYFGGGGSSTNFWRVNADGTVTQRASLPFVVGSNTAEGHGALYRGTRDSKMFAISSGGSVREFDHLTNSWSAQVTTLPFTASQGIYFACPIDEYGVVAFVWIASGLVPSTTMYLWKR